MENTENRSILRDFIESEFEDEKVRESLFEQLSGFADGDLRDVDAFCVQYRNLFKAEQTAIRSIEAAVLDVRNLIAVRDCVREFRKTPLESDNISKFAKLSGLLDVLLKYEGQLKECVEFSSGLAKITARRGGTSIGADIAAETVAEIFADLGLLVTFGQSHDGEPSTKYCRTVRLVFEISNAGVHWRRPSERAFRAASTKDMK